MLPVAASADQTVLPGSSRVSLEVSSAGQEETDRGLISVVICFRPYKSAHLSGGGGKLFEMKVCITYTTLPILVSVQLLYFFLEFVCKANSN